ncbi:hypothetical protein GDO78_008094 [Eleutherodactylus coqui]|uniref:Uncharacterized protein n=1 Tax=Eleutherodactylus coqui TaxID=57060 RepID=A0A8J6FC25_ELECQ|nr:hypothetical protein GDO78_008094 [Eleutherodactylus coqui]
MMVGVHGRRPAVRPGRTSVFRTHNSHRKGLSSLKGFVSLRDVPVGQTYWQQLVTCAQPFHTLQWDWWRWQSRLPPAVSKK